MTSLGHHVMEPHGGARLHLNRNPSCELSDSVGRYRIFTSSSLQSVCGALPERVKCYARLNSCGILVGSFKLRALERTCSRRAEICKNVKNDVRRVAVPRSATMVVVRIKIDALTTLQTHCRRVPPFRFDHSGVEGRLNQPAGPSERPTA